VSQSGEPIRSYQRIFRPERRIYQLEGRSLPVPGGVPLRWLAYACAALVSVLAIGSGSPALAALLAGAAALGGLHLGDRSAAALAGAAAFALFWFLGALLALLDWPLRLIVLPVAVATLATQATPDGRRADRFAASWIALRLAPRRRSLGRGLPLAGVPQIGGGAVWVAPDEHGPLLRRARIRGAGTLAFAQEVCLCRAALRPQRLIAGPPAGRSRPSELRARNVALGYGDLLEVRP
jgi:hypothetical protein